MSHSTLADSLASPSLTPMGASSHPHAGVPAVNEKCVLPSAPARRIARITAVAGVVLLALGLLIAIGQENGMRQFCVAYLLNLAFWLSISLAALVFVLLQHVTRAGWSVTVRRLCEILAANVGLCVLLAVPVIAAAVLGRGILYPWTSPEYLQHHPEIAARAFYPNLPLFLIRLCVCFSAWIALARFMHRHSLRQDQTGDPACSRAMQRLSAPGLVIMGFTVTFAAFDLLMSLDPGWMSTIFGIYYFSGGMVGFLAVLILAAALLQRRDFLTASVQHRHYHDLGKYLFGFVFFWGYIAFSQYMLIWYGNIPEETAWLLRRGASTNPADFGPWTIISVALLLGQLLLPFAGLISRRAKLRTGILCFWAAWVLAAHWLDLLWLVAPESVPNQPARALSGRAIAVDVVCLVGMGLLYFGGAAWLAAGRSLRPLRDPRLAEALSTQVG